jgi:hypothetical protein
MQPNSRFYRAPATQNFYKYLAENKPKRSSLKNKVTPKKDLNDKKPGEQPG